MRIRHIIPLLLLAGGITVGAQTTNTPLHPKTMSYTLTFDESQKTIANPKESDIRAAVTTHKDDFGPVFQIGLDNSKEVFQIDAQGSSRFSFDYGDGGNVGYISKREDFSLEEAVKILTAYCTGTPDWKKTVDWKELKQ